MTSSFLYVNFYDDSFMRAIFDGKYRYYNFPGVTTWFVTECVHLTMHFGYTLHCKGLGIKLWLQTSFF